MCPVGKDVISSGMTDDTALTAYQRDRADRLPTKTCCFSVLNACISYDFKKLHH